MRAAIVAAGAGARGSPGSPRGHSGHPLGRLMRPQARPHAGESATSATLTRTGGRVAALQMLRMHGGWRGRGQSSAYLQHHSLFISICFKIFL